MGSIHTINANDQVGTGYPGTVPGPVIDLCLLAVAAAAGKEANSCLLFIINNIIDKTSSIDDSCKTLKQSNRPL